MKTDSFLKRYVPLILTISFGVLLLLCALGLELNLHFKIYKLRVLSRGDIFRILSDAFFVPSVFLLGTALIGFCKYINLLSVLYSAIMSLRDLITLGFVPKSCRKANRAYRKAAKEDNGTGLAILFVTGFVFLALAVIFLLIYTYI